jgi:hypothetical protein
VAQHCHVVGDTKSVAEFVRDEHNGAAGVSNAPEPGKELRSFRRCEHRGRFVENENAGGAGEGFEDLDALLAGDREIADSGGRVDLQADFRAELPNGASGLVSAIALVTRRCPDKGNVLGHCHAVYQRIVLLDHPNSCRERVRRRSKFLLDAIDQDPAAVGADHPVRDAHERCLSGAILAEERVHGAVVDVELCVVERSD